MLAQSDLKIQVNKQGIVFIAGLADPLPSFIRRSRKSSWCWTTCHWLDELQKLGLPVAEIYQQSFLKHKLMIMKLLHTKAIYKTDIFERVFRIPLWDAQKQAASIMASAGKFYLADLVGCGKTASALGAIVLLKEKCGIERVLILTTASTKYQWKLEIKNFIRPEYYPEYSVQLIDGSAKERHCQFSDPGFFTICGYEALRESASTKDFVFSPDVVVFDEAWKFKSRITKLYRLLKHLFQHTQYKFLLNAAPMGNGYEELFAPIDVMDERHFICWGNFRDRYLNYDMVKIPKRHPVTKKFLGFSRPFQKLVGYKNIDDLKNRLTPFMLRRTPETMGMGFPKLTVTPYWVELAAIQRQAYAALIQASIEPIAKIGLARTICSFAPNQSIVETPKLLLLKEFIKNIAPDEKLIVFSESERFISAIDLILRDHDIKAAKITGDIPSKIRERVKGDFTERDIKVLLLTAAGEAGLNLQAADIVINLDLPWNLERLKQRIGRVRPYLGSKDRHIRVINILAKDTIEERICQKIHEKAGYFARLFDEQIQDLTGIFSTSELLKLL